MTFDYSKSQATATRLLTQFGRAVTRHVFTAGAYDPATGSVTNTTADTSRKGVLLNYSGNESGETFIRGNLVLATDRKLLLDGTGPATVTDEYTVGSQRFTVMSVLELNPAGTSVMFELHLRAQ